MVTVPDRFRRSAAGEGGAQCWDHFSRSNKPKFVVSEVER